jgi:hypothetical protein
VRKKTLRMNVRGDRLEDDWLRRSRGPQKAQAVMQFGVAARILGAWFSFASFRARTRPMRRRRRKGMRVKPGDFERCLDSIHRPVLRVRGSPSFGPSCRQVPLPDTDTRRATPGSPRDRVKSRPASHACLSCRLSRLIKQKGGFANIPVTGRRAPSSINSTCRNEPRRGANADPRCYCANADWV